MAIPIQSRTRLQIRQAIGVALGVLKTGTTSSTSDTSSLVDTYGLVDGANDNYRGRQVVIVTPAGSIVAGEKSFVSSSVTTDATCAPVFTASITILDAYEMWQIFLAEDIESLINLAIMEVSSQCFQLKQATDVFTLEDTYEYAISSFKGLNKVEYVYSIAVDHLLENCEDAWTAGTSVTATADTAFKKVGTYSAKFVVAAGAASGATLGYEDITEVDISDADKIEFWMYSSIALTAGQLQSMLGATAAIASPLETINIPAMDAATWYRLEISLANPHLDTAIISLGVRQASGVDVGAFTFYLDDIHAVLANSKEYKELNPQHWDVVKGSSPKLMLTAAGKSVIGDNKQLRLSGYQLPVLLNADATVSEIEPSWLVKRVWLEALRNHAKSPQLTLADRLGVADRLAVDVERGRSAIRTQILPNIRWC